MNRPKYKNECTCKMYSTSFDFDSIGTAEEAARLHCMLPGTHKVLIWRMTLPSSIPVLVAAVTGEAQNPDGPCVLEGGIWI